jgi:CHAT domain-containing protein/tetratricopeptide (TPR) repeat protein
MRAHLSTAGATRRLGGWVAAVTCLLAPSAHGADEPPARPLTAAQQQRLQERDRLDQQARQLAAAGQPAEAINAAEAMLAIELEVLGRDHDDVVGSLQFLGQLHRDRGDIVAARQALREVLEIQTRRHGRADWRAGDARRALEDLERWTELTADRRRQLDEAGRLDHEVEALYAQGRFAEAIAPARRALAVRRAVQGERHPDYANSLNNLAMLLAAQGDYAAAKPLLEQALAVTQAALGERHPRYATGLNNLALLLQSQGDYAAARPLYEQALAVRKAVLGERHPHYARGLNNLAVLLQEQGDYIAARPLLERALAVTQAAVGERHPDYATGLNNLALLLYAQGDYAAARPLYEQALAVRKAAQGERHPDYANSLNNLAGLLEAQGDYAAARPLYEQALAVYKAAQGERHPDYAASLHNLAGLLEAQGDYAAARPLYEQALAVRKAAQGERHPTYALSLNNLALLLQAQGDDAGARRACDRALDSYEDLVTRTAPTLRERERLALLARFQFALFTALSLSAGRAEPEADAYRRLLLWKGLADADAAARRRAAADPRLQDRLLELNQLRARANRLVNARVPAERAEQHAQELRALADRRAALEAELARAVGWDPRPPSPAQVAAALPPRAALVDLLGYTHSSAPVKGEHRLRREVRYVAFVVRAGGPPRRVEVGPAAPIDGALARWRHQVQDGQAEPDAGELARRLWGPLAAHLEGADTVLVAPDGALNFLAWGALPDPKRPGSYLLERLAFATVASGRHLVEQARHPPPSAAATLLAVGGVDYQRGDFGPRPSPGPAPAAPTLVAARDTTRAAPAAGHGWRALPGTRAQADAVAALFRRATRAEAEVLTGPQATKDRLRAALGGRRYLHLATHGYFADPKFKSALAPPQDSKTALGSWEALGRSEATGLYPGLLAGLVGAGANAPPTDPTIGVLDVGAGIMTAEEVAGLDLHGCELAVLSACDTGLGLTAGGQGVLGLQRAFHQAGVHAVVASLWKVHDAATSVLMEQFYTNLWVQKLPKLQALRRAQLAVLNDPGLVERRRTELAQRRLTELAQRGIGEVAGELPEGGRIVPPDRSGPGRRSPPVWWAAFVLSGDGR